MTSSVDLNATKDSNAGCPFEFEGPLELFKPMLLAANKHQFLEIGHILKENFDHFKHSALLSFKGGSL